MVVALPDENNCEEKGGVARCCSVYACQSGGQSETALVTSWVLLYIAEILQYCERVGQSDTALVNISALVTSWVLLYIVEILQYCERGGPIRNISRTHDIWASPKSWARVLLCAHCVCRVIYLLVLVSNDLIKKASLVCR